MANSCVLPSCFFFFSLILSHVMIVQVEASHYVHENLESVQLESVQPAEPDEKHRTSYHFQPPKNWMNGNIVFINSSIKKNETSFLLVFFFLFELSSSFLTCFFALCFCGLTCLAFGMDKWDLSLDLQTPMVRSLFPLLSCLVIKCGDSSVDQKILAPSNILDISSIKFVIYIVII